MKRSALTLLVIALLLCLLAVLTACGDLLDFFRLGDGETTDQEADEQGATISDEDPSQEDPASAVLLLGISGIESTVNAEDGTLVARVGHDTDTLSASDLIFSEEEVSFRLYADEERTRALSDLISLEVGDNLFYLFIDEELSYLLTITREEAPHEHAFGDPVIINQPSCRESGLSRATCACGETQDAILAPLPHTPMTDSALSPTCTQTGLGEGSHCSVCLAILVEQTVLPALGHDLITHGALAPTCTLEGHQAYDTCSRCDYTTYLIIPAAGHTVAVDAARSPTCTETGLTEGSHCSVCSVVLINQNVLPATGHDYGAWIPTLFATCEEQGTEQRQCRSCFALDARSTPALGHDKIAHAALAATCTTAGYESYDTCSRCDYTTYRTIPALGHDYALSVTPPTCLADGYTTHSCTRCEEAFADNYVTALGHDLIPHDALAPTCTKEGHQAYDTCSRCAYNTYQTIPATGHTSVIDPQIDPTCTETGLTAGAHCSVCSVVLVEPQVVAATGHSPADPAEENIVSATCTQAGSYDMVTRCAVCDSELSKETLPISPLGHDLTHHDAKEATCTKSGYEAYDTCSRCDYTTYQTIPALGHDYQVKVTEPKCLSQGYTTHTCSRCKNFYNDEYTPALGHAITHHSAQTPTCTQDGNYAYDDCSRCDYTTYLAIPATGHTPLSDPAVNPTCTETGLTAGSHCSVCSEVLEARLVVPATGHTPADPVEENTLYPTCTQAGSYDSVTYCSTCSQQLSSSHLTIPALGHDYTATHKDADCLRYERKEWACTRCDAAYTQVIGSTLAPHAYEAYTCTVCQHDEMADYQERFASGSTVTLTSIREIAILIDYLILHHNTSGVKFKMTGMTVDNYMTTINAAHKMTTNTNWPLGVSYSTLGGTLQYVTLSCSSSYSFDMIATITPESGDYTPTHYAQQDFYEVTNESPRASDYDDFPYQDRLHTLSVSTSEQLFFAFEHGYRPIPVANSTAARLLNKAKAVNRAILNDDMSDREKIYRVMQWLVQNVEYDYGVINASVSYFYSSSYYLEGVFDYGLAVCDAYSKATCVLLGLEDIKCVRTAGNGHAWNRVYIDPDEDGIKQWYVLDTTHANCGFSDIDSEIFVLNQFLITDAQKTSLGYTADNYTDINCAAVTEVNPFAACYYGEESASCDYVISSLTEMKALFNQIASQLPPDTTYFTVNIFVPKTYCSTVSSLTSAVNKSKPSFYSFYYANSECTYEGVEGWNLLVILSR